MDLLQSRSCYRSAFIAVAAVIIGARAAAADIVVTSMNDFPSGAAITYSGTNVALGQSFVAPSGATALDSFAIRINIGIGTASITGVRAYVFAADGTQALGEPLFRSEPLGPLVFTELYQTVSLTGMNAPVTPGGTYVLLFSDYEMGRTSSQMFYFGIRTIAGNAANPLLLDGVGLQSAEPTLTGTPWGTISSGPAGGAPGRDFAIELRFVPSPSALTIVGLAAAATCWRRRR